MAHFAIGEELVSGHEHLKLIDFPSHLQNLNIDYNRFSKEINEDNLEQIKQWLNKNESSVLSISNIEVPAVGSPEKVLESFKNEIERVIRLAYRLECSYLFFTIQKAPTTITQENIERYFIKIASILNEIVLLSKKENFEIALWTKPSTTVNSIGLSDAIKYLESFYHKYENFGFAIDSSFFYFENDLLKKNCKTAQESFFVKCIQISEPYYYQNEDIQSIFNFPPNFRFHFDSYKLSTVSPPLFLGTMNSLADAPKDLYGDIICKLYTKKYMKLLSLSNLASQDRNIKMRIQSFEEEYIKGTENSFELPTLTEKSGLLTSLINDFEESALYRAFCINELKKSIGLN